MEIWKDVIGYDNVYQISNLGRVRSLNRTDVDCHGRMQKRKGKLIKPTENSNGYLRVYLAYRGKKEKRFIHRMVAEAFVPNSDPDINDIVNHMDCNPKNNKYDNLEWTTRKGNIQYAVLKGRMKRNKKWIERLYISLDSVAKPIEMIDIVSGNVIKRYRHLNDCSKDGFCPSSVCKCCKNQQKQHKGYAWRYAKK